MIEPTGALVVALREQRGSGLSGVAVLSPADDGTTTDVSVFLTGGATAAGAENGATPVAQTVQVASAVMAGATPAP